MAKAKKPAAQKPAAQPDYLKSLGIQAPDLSGLPQNWSPQTAAAVQQYYAPGGGFQQTLNTEMQPTGQGGYTVRPEYAGVTAPTQPIAYPIGPEQGPPLQTAPPQPTPTPTPTPTPQPPPPPPPPPQATMDWSGLASGLQGILAPYLSGQAHGTAGNPMGQIMPLLMSKLGGYLGTLQPTQAGQQAAASQTALDPNATQGQGQMNWGNLGSTLQNWGGQNTQQTQANLMNQLLGYLGTVPNTQTGQPPTSASTPLGVMSQNVPQYAIR